MELSFLQRMFPGFALKREIAKAQILAVGEQTRLYDAGTQTAYRPKNIAYGPDGSPQLSTQDAGAEMRRYARNLDENEPLAISVLDTLVNQVVGTGVPIHPMVKNRDGSLNSQVNDQIRRIIEDWSVHPTADRQCSFQEAQRLLCRSWMRDGEVLINMLRGNMPGIDHGQVIPLTLELLEADYLPWSLNSTRGRTIIQGVELNKYYQPTGYYLAKSHPGDSWQGGQGVFATENDFNRIDADQVIHLKFRRRINQVRGVSILHGAMRAIEDIGDMNSSERIAARVAAAFTGYIKRSPDVQTTINATTGNRDLEMSPGMIFDNLLPGEDIGTINSNRPNSNLEGFVMGQSRQVAGATGTNASTITKNYDTGSYSSQRQSMVEAKPAYDALRQHFAHTAIRPIYRDIVDLAITTGALVFPRTVDRETIHDMFNPGVALPLIDAKKEIEGDQLRVSSQFASKSQVISERGGDPTQVAAQIENDTELFPEQQNVMDPQAGDSGTDEEIAEPAEVEEA